MDKDVKKQSEDKENALPTDENASAKEDSPLEIKTKAEGVSKPEEEVEISQNDKYAAILSLDEEEGGGEAEQWSERTSIITKIDHELYQSYAREVIDELVGNVRTPEKKQQ